MSVQFNDSTWNYIAKWATEKLRVERDRNDDQKQDAVQTAFLRGRISAYKELLALPVTRPAQENEE